MKIRALAVLLAAGVSSVLASQCQAQVVYAPVQYQYDATGNGDRYYYGGSDPQVFGFAYRTAVDPRYDQRYGRRLDGSPEKAFEESYHPLNLTRLPVYSDNAPYVDVRRFGYTANDARNQANYNAARYFRKSDLLASAIPQPDGSMLVLPTAPVMTSVASTRNTAVAGMKRGTIVIIARPPKDKAAEPPKGVLAAAKSATAQPASQTVAVAVKAAPVQVTTTK